MMKYTYLLLLLLLFGFTGVMAQTVSIENAVKAPGDVAVAVTMTDFTGSNGNVQSIQFQISFDDDLLYFKGIENINPNFASWVYPANGASSPITLSYTNLTGQDINTKIFDLKFGYSGGLGFNGAINFVTTGCEITHNFLSPIAATYNNGSISQTASSAFVDLGTTQQASVTSPVTVDVNMQAPSFSAFTYKIGYDPSKLTFLQATNSVLGGTLIASALNGVITATWSGSYSAPSATNVFDLKFTYNGGGDAAVEFKPGSQITNSVLALVPTTYANSLVQNLPSGSSLSMPPVNTPVDHDILVPVTFVYAGSGFVGSVNMKIGYNNSIVTYKGFTTGTLGTGVVASVANGVITVVWDKSSNTSGLDGTLLNLKFTSIANGNSPLTFNAGTTVTQTNLSNVPLSYNNGSVTVADVTLTGASQASTVCAGSGATINLTGLQPSTTSTVSYSINSVPQTPVTGVVSDGSGAASFSSAALIAGNNGQTLQITEITITSSFPNPSGTFAQNVTLSVNAATVAGTVTGGTTICDGSSSALMTLAGYTGSIVRWESSVSPFSSWTPITNTDATYTSGALTATTQFRAVVQSGVCAEASSVATTVTVNAATVAGTVSGGTSICSGSTSGELTLAGYTGSIVRWESSISPFSSWTPIVNTDATYTSGTLAATTQFRAVVQSGVCAEAASVATTVTVNPASITSDPSNQTINLGAGTSFSVTATCALSYQWKFSTDGGTTYNNLSNGGSYGDVTTATMSLTGAIAAMNGYKYLCEVQPGNVNSLAATLTVNPLTVNVKVMLQGAYNGTDMNITLRNLNRIPLAQPYGVAPYNTAAFTYAGTESVLVYPTNIVDWVLVELRTGTASGTMVSKKAGFVLKSGSVVGVDGVSPLVFTGINAGNYYVVVRHRNHLPIMSAAAQALSSTSTLYDFTTAMNKAYGTNPMATLAGGRFGLWGGNANLNNNVRYGGPSNDPAAISAAIGTSVVNAYSQYDVNMNGNARYGGPSNDPASISIYVGISVVTSQVP